MTSPESLLQISLLGPTPELLNQNLYCIMIPDDSYEISSLRSTVQKGIVNSPLKTLGLR